MAAMQNLHSSQESLFFPWSAGSLEQLLEVWKGKLKNWALQGAISRAATDALGLTGEPQALQTLVSQWAGGDFLALPPVVLLPADAMPGAAGAYALSTRTIYLNQDWLEGASTKEAVAVLTEELGHHLDGLLNAADTPGDEGELFAALLLREGWVRGEQCQAFLAEDDNGLVLVGGDPVNVERAAVVVSAPVQQSSTGKSKGEYLNFSAFAALRADGSVVSWGNPSKGGDSSQVKTKLSSGVEQIYSNPYAYAALKADGSVISWGDPEAGGNSNNVDFDGPRNNLKVLRIFSTSKAFAALRDDGSVVTWGAKRSGGEPISYSDGFSLSYGIRPIKDEYQNLLNPTVPHKIIDITSNRGAFAALRADGSVLTWGDPWSGAYSKSADLESVKNGAKVAKIRSTRLPFGAFAVLLSDGSVRSWGYDLFNPAISKSGGYSDHVDFNGPGNNLKVIDLFSSDDSFSALRSDGSILSWRKGSIDGTGELVTVDPNDNNLRIAQVFSNQAGFAAIRSDGSVLTWWDSANASSVAKDLKTGVKTISTTVDAFAALKVAGQVITWGSPSAGGDSSKVASELSSDVVEIISSSYAFAALKRNGSVVTWGDARTGGMRVRCPANYVRA